MPVLLARDAAARVRAGAGRHPRHLVLFAAVLGLLAGPVSTTAVAGAALLCLAVAPAAPLAAGAATAAAGAGAFAAARAEALEHGPLETLHGRTVRARATVLEPPRRRAGGMSVARVRLLDGPARGDVGVVRWRRAFDWPPVGHEVRFVGAAGPVDGPEAWQRRRGAHALIDAVALDATGARRGGPVGVLDAIRERGLAALGDRTSPDGALLRGMVLGADDDVPQDVRDAFATTSLAHLLAVSGQNVVLLSTLVMVAAAAVGLGLRGRLVAALLCVAAYVPITGAGASIQRAGVMGAAGLVAGLAGRHGARWYAVGLAALVTLAWNPHAVRDVGWQLSFAAVIALLVGARPIADGVRDHGVPPVVADALGVTLAATLGTAPLLALQFEQVSAVALPANLLAAPVVAPVMWLGMVAAAVAQVDVGVARAVAAPALALVAYVRALAETLATVPGAALAPGATATAGIAAASIAALASLAAGPRRLRAAAAAIGSGTGGGPVPGRRPLVAAALAAVIGFVVFGLRPGGGPPPPAPGELVAAFLDVGQGDATLVRRDGASVLVDTGPPDGPVVDRLAAEGVARLDVLLLTHAQADHEGAALDVIREYRPRLIINGGDGQDSTVQRALEPAAAVVGARVVNARAGQVLRLGGMVLRVLWPPPRDPGSIAGGDPNDRAVVSHFRAGAFDLLLPADAESGVTTRLDLPVVDAFKVAHHGSADDGLARLLGRIRPAIAAIPVGRRNTYGHPAPSTLGVLRGVPHVLRTDRDGTIRLRVQEGRMTIERTGAQG